MLQLWGMIKQPEMRVHDLRAEYIGCFKTRRSQGNTMADPTQRWHDPHYRIFEEDHSRYAEGPFYALRGRVISAILRAGLAPRLGGPEGNASSRRVYIYISLYSAYKPQTQTLNPHKKT